MLISVVLKAGYLALRMDMKSAVYLVAEQVAWMVMRMDGKRVESLVDVMAGNEAD